SAPGERSGHRPYHRHSPRRHGGRTKRLPQWARVRRLVGLGAAAEFNRWKNPAGRHHQARQPLFASVADQWASANLLRSKATKADPWVIGLRRRRPPLVVAVALANKTARIAWAVMLREKEYQPRAMAA